MKVLFYVPPGPRDAILPALPPHWNPHFVHEPAGLTDALLDGVDVLLITAPLHAPRALLARLRSVKLVQQIGVGVDNIDLAAARELGIPVCNAARANVVSVAEYVIMAAIYLVRRRGEAIEAGRRHHNPYPALFQKGTFELAGKSHGVVGYGAIGHAVATRAQSLGMKILSESVRNRPPGDDERALAVTRLPFSELLRQADVVTLHVPLAPETRGLLGERELRSMKPGAVLFNAARGHIVDEAALAGALRSGHLAGAAVDNYADDELRPGNPLLDAPNALLTPHAAGSTNECVRTAVALSFANVERVRRGEAPVDRVA